MDALITEDIKEFISRVKLGFIATVCPDGTPNLSPKGTTIAWDDHHLAFADIHSPGTIDNLKTNPAIEINIVDVFTRKGFRFKGIGQILSEGDSFERVLSHYRDNGTKHPINNIVLVKVNRILPLISPAYFTPRSEEEIKDYWIQYWNEKNQKH
jgi:predicted pyridoxine 5'-phosphate oxidase superfamily flavin-nucleotide-binding protein